LQHDFSPQRYLQKSLADNLQPEAFANRIPGNQFPFVNDNSVVVENVSLRNRLKLYPIARPSWMMSAVFPGDRISRTTFAGPPSNGRAVERGHPSPHQSGFPLR
jgi:hypothetical protein